MSNPMPRVDLRSRAAGIAVAIALLSGSLVALVSDDAAAVASLTEDECGPIVDDDTGRWCLTSAGMIKTFSTTTGKFIGYHHGGDPIDLGRDPFAEEEDEDASTFGSNCPGGQCQLEGGGRYITGARQPHCVNPVSSPNPGYYMHVAYVRYFNQADTYAANADTIREYVREANGLLHDTTKERGKPLLYKVKCADNDIVVENVVLPNQCSQADCFNDIVSQMSDMGYNDPKVKYWIWTEDTRCTCGGKGHQFPDTSPGPGNRNNGNAATPTFAVTFHGTPGVRVMMHENGHNLGAVQSTPQYATYGHNNAGHCWDGTDIMCYGEPGEAKTYDSGVCPGNDVWDCNHDTYCDPKPDAGEWLASNWNLCNVPTNRYLVPGNAVPTTVEDTATMNEDGPTITIPVLQNDYDEDGDILILQAVQDPPSGGTAVIEGNVVKYTPKPDYFGVDVFTYEVRDREDPDNETVMKGVGTIRVTVLPLNDGPEAFDALHQTTEDTPIDLSLVAVDVDGDILSYTITKPPNKGVLQGAAGSSDRRYVPDPDFHGIDSFTFTVTDGELVSQAAKVRIDVLPVNDPPQARDDFIVVLEGIDWAIPILENDDAGPGTELDTPNFRLCLAESPDGVVNGTDLGASLSWNDAGTPGDPMDDYIVYAKGGASYGPLPAYDRFVYTIRDGPSGPIDCSKPTNPNSLTATATVDIEVVSADFAALPDFYETSEDTALTVDVNQGVLLRPSPAVPASSGQVRHDRWAGAPGDLAAVTATLVEDVENGFLDLEADGSFTYEPDPDWAGVDVFTYRLVSPTEGESNVIPVRITVTPVNDPPVAISGDVTMSEDSSVSIILSGTDEEDEAHLLQYAVVQPPLHGTLLHETGAMYTYIPDAEYSGSDKLSFQVIDTEGATDIGERRITVTGVNDRPVGRPDFYLVRPGQTNRISGELGVLQNDHDADGDALVAELKQTARYGSVELDLSGGFRYHAAKDYVGQDSFLYMAIDPSSAGSILVPVTLDIQHNIPPVAAFTLPSGTIQAGRALTLHDRSTDADGRIQERFWEMGDGTSYTTREVKHTYVEPGQYEVRLTVVDNDGVSAMESYTLLVSQELASDFGGSEPDGLPPIADAGIDQDVMVGQSVILDGSASTPGSGDLMVYLWKQTGGPQVRLGDASGPNPFLKAPMLPRDQSKATLTFEMTIFDGIQESAPDIVQVHVFAASEAKPIFRADAGPDQVFLSGDQITIEGKSEGLDGVTGYQWQQREGPRIGFTNGQVLAFEAPYVSAPTTLKFWLTASAHATKTPTDELVLTILPAQTPRGIEASSAAEPGQAIRFDAIVPEGSPTSLDYHWNFGDNTTAEGLVAEHQYSGPGIYNVVLTATHALGFERNWTHQVVIEDTSEAKAPLADAAADKAARSSAKALLVVGLVGLGALGLAGGAYLLVRRRQG